MCFFVGGTSVPVRLAQFAALGPESVGAEAPPTEAFSADPLSRVRWRRLPACVVPRRRSRRRCAHRN
ncbi:DUF6053 domain-containing protein [Lysobacter enzymogenes]|uniref:DUF6053 domain-containing protein n=1 Tax=Lysobacter enzymogenes TaxID=69 RepID=UPI003D18C30A